MHEALGVGVGFVIPGNIFVLVSGYLATLATLVIFGIWGFRLGAKGPGGNGGGGGPKRPGPVPPPPPGGRELDDERLFTDLDLGGVFEPPAEHAQEPERELVGSRSEG